MDLRLLRTFLTAARVGSFSLAAERLYLAQPTVTVHITRLEQQLGSSLFERSHGGVVLTPAGRRFLPHAARVLEAFESGVEDLTAWSQGYNVRISILSSPLIAATALPPLLRRYTESWPSAELSLDVRQSAEIGPALVAGAADLGLSLMAAAERGLASESLYDDPVVLVAPHDGRDWDREPPDAEEILERNMVFTHNHPEYWEDLLLGLRQQGARLRTMKVSDMNVTKRLVAEGLGVSFLPARAVWRELVEGRLMEVPTPGLSLPRSHTYLVTPREGGMSQAAGAFVHLLRQTFGTT